MSANEREIKLRPCPFCGGKADVTDFGVTSFIIEPDGCIVGDISCAGCAASVTCAGGEDERCHESDFGCKRLHPIDLWKVAEATMEKWNRRVAQEGGAE